MKWLALALAGLVTPLAAEEKLDREAIVRRHHPVLVKPDKLTPFGLGWHPWWRRISDRDRLLDSPRSGGLLACE